jgi:glycosyltransferase involved in cell wall biosynthesis
MNKAVRVLSYLLFFFCSAYAKIEVQHAYDPLLVVVIMVKDEETVMRATLQPFIDGGVDAFLVFDTGSTDKTVEVTQEFFAEHNLEKAYIVQEPFIDFATSRNRALDLAQVIFPQAAFMVMPDAEWYINDAQALRNFCQLALDRGDTHPAYLVHIVNQALDNYTCRLIRCNSGARFGGVVHETITHPTGVKVPEDVYFEYLPAQLGVEKTAARFVRDRNLLLKEHERNPLCTRTLFYLARTCEDLGDWEEAYDFYKERVGMVGWDEEDFIVNYRLAETIKKLVLKKQDKRYTWDEALAYYMRAYQMRPHRIEPLVAIGDYYVAIGEMQLAYLFANRAAEIPYSSDILFVEKYIYDYYRYELLTRCAWYINEFEVGEWAARMAYQARPEYELAQRNLAVYKKRRMCCA